MDYHRIYNSIITKASIEDRKKLDTTYYERHHKIPKCIGGSDDKENLVLLTAKEHFICHHLLTKMYPDNKLKFAFWAMCNQLNGDVTRTYKVTPTVYEQAKKKFSIANSLLHKGKTMSQEHIDRSRDMMTKNNPHKGGESSHLYQVPRTDTVKSQISQTKLNQAEKNGMFKGHYLTPKGRFASVSLAAKANGLTIDSVRSRCNKNTVTINNHHMRCKDLTESDLGKTFMQLGYSFEPVPVE